MTRYLLRIEDAPVLTVLLDRDNDIWIRLNKGALVLSGDESKEVFVWREKHLNMASSEFGPFEDITKEYRHQYEVKVHKS